MKNYYPGESFRFTIGRVEYVAEIHHDDSQGAPWEECDGYGEVSDWTTRQKRPGEFILSEDGRSKRYYDFAASCRIARQDGWGSLPGDLIIDRFAHSGARKFRAFVAGDKQELTAYGRDRNAATSALYAIYRATMTARQWAAAAAMRDYENLRAWCNDEWCYIGIVVRRADDYTCCGASESLWGIESDCGNYALEVAKDLAEELGTSKRAA